MAFCNACGATLEAGAKFCPKCGAALNVPAPAPVSPAAANANTAPSAVLPAGAAPVQPQGSSAVKIILIIVLVIAGLGFLTIGGLVFVGWRLAHNSHIRNDHGNVRIDSPFGTVETTNDPKEAARNLGVDVFPGATVVNGGGANVSFGNMHTSAAEFESSAPVGVVAKFYQSRYPNANVTTSENGRSTIVSGDKDNLLTISIEEQDGKTHIHVARVMEKSSGS